MEEESQGDFGAKEGRYKEKYGEDQAKLAWLLMPQQQEAIDNLKIKCNKNFSAKVSLTSESLDLHFWITVPISGADITSGWSGVNVSLSSSAAG